jgi:hypothetical protein
MSFAKPGATTSELVASLIRESGLTLDNDVATNLIMGIEEGSSNFGSSEVTASTFEVFAHLLRSGGQRLPRVKLSPADFPPGAIPTKPFRAPIQRPVTPMQQVEVQAEATVPEVQSENIDIDPPADWLQPKIYKGASVSQNQPTSYSENKG